MIDLQMPILDGVAVTTLLRSRPEAQNVPIIVMTASGGPQEWKLLSSLGADRFLVKPVNLDDVVATLRSAVRERSSSSPNPPAPAAASATAPTANAAAPAPAIRLATVTAAAGRNSGAKIATRSSSNAQRSARTELRSAERLLASQECAPERREGRKLVGVFPRIADRAREARLRCAQVARELFEPRERHGFDQIAREQLLELSADLGAGRRRARVFGGAFERAQGRLQLRRGCQTGSLQRS